MVTSSSAAESGRDPCPWRIFEDVGSAYAMGCAGGGLFHAFKGVRNSPKGDKLSGMAAAIKNRAPALGGNFATWMGLFSSFDCTMAHYRGVEDPYNAIASGFFTSGALAMRGGAKVAFRSAVLGGVVLAVFEGISIGITRVMASMTLPQKPELLPPGAPMPEPPKEESVLDQVSEKLGSIFQKEEPIQAQPLPDIVFGDTSSQQHTDTSAYGDIDTSRDYSGAGSTTTDSFQSGSYGTTSYGDSFNDGRSTDAYGNLPEYTAERVPEEEPKARGGLFGRLWG